MEKALMVTTRGYWKDHFDIGKTGQGLTEYLIGQSRARIMIINIVLPFFAALGIQNNNEPLRGKTMALYNDYPQTEENTIGRHLQKQLGIERKIINSYRRQQGLLHLYKRYYKEGRCAACLFTALPASDPAPHPEKAPMFCPPAT
jgi:hypothetical protein